MSKKKLIALSLVVIMIAILSYNTLAWFQAQDKVTNEFYISSSLTSFDVDVWEEVDKDEDGTPEEIGKGTKDETDGTKFEKVVPNKEYLKTVHVENTSGNVLAGQYIKVEVTFTNYSSLKEMGESGDYDCTGMLMGGYFSEDETDSTAWWYDSANNKANQTDNTMTYTFYLKDVLENEEDMVLFDSVKLPNTMDINDAYLLGDDGFQIKVVAYAIQNANIADPNGTTTLDHAIYAFSDQLVDNNIPAPTTNP